MSRSIVILAAGTGSRLNSIKAGQPKPLTSLCGVALIERCIKNAKRSGFDHFVIVVGYQAEQVQKYLADGSELGVRIDFVKNNNWHKKNGISLLMASEALDSEAFILLMADHVLDIDFFHKLQSIEMGDDDLVLLTDKKISSIFDLEDATKVQASPEGYIQDIGKQITTYNCIDTGAFIISKKIFTLLDQRAKANGDVSVSEGVQALMQLNKARIHDIGDLWWQDVDTPQSYRQAERVLLKKQIKPTDVWVSRYLNRPISLFISRFLVKTSLTPNQITYLSFLTGLAAPFFLVQGSYLGFVLGGLAYHMASVLDGCDGEVARLKMMESTSGEWVDTIIDNLTHVLFVMGLAWGLYQSTQGQRWPIYLGIFSLASIAWVLAMMFRYLRSSGRGTLLAFNQAFEDQRKSDPTIWAKFSMLAKPLIRRATYAFIFFIMMLLGQAHWVLILMSIAPFVTGCMLMVNHRKIKNQTV